MAGNCEQCNGSLPRLSIFSICDRCKAEKELKRIRLEEEEKIRANRQTQKNLMKNKKSQGKEKKSSHGIFDKFRKYNDVGFDKDGLHKDTGTMYNPFGFDKDGYDIYGYDCDMYTKEGFGVDGFDGDGYDKDGFGRDRYDKDGYDRNGFGRDMFNRNGRNRFGYDRDGYDRDGFGKDGYNKSGLDRRGHDKEYYIKFQEEQKQQKEIRDAEIRERENQAYKKFQEEQLKNPREDYSQKYRDNSQNYKDTSVEDALKNLANEIFKEKPQHTREYSYTSKQKPTQEYRSPPKPTQQKTNEYSDIPDFSSDDPYRILGVKPEMSLSEIKQKYRELSKEFYAARGSMDRTKDEQEKIEFIQAKINKAWDLINNKT